jgi:hypothetical protein
MPETKSTGGHAAKKPASAAKTATVAQTGAEAKPTLQGVKATGAQVELRGIDLIEIAGGKNTSMTAYYDGNELRPPDRAHARPGLGPRASDEGRLQRGY